MNLLYIFISVNDAEVSFRVDCCKVDFNVNMAQFSANVAKMARILAITQILTGLLLFSIGIVDRCVPGGFTGYVYFGVWIGIWVSNIS